jgi:ATP-dependent Clp protease ATP-binding subunit ClpA
MFGKFTDRARRVVVLAQEEARMLNHGYVGTGHLLLGLIREGEGVAAQVLVKLGGDLNRVRQEVFQLIHSDPGQESVPAEARRLERGSATEYLAYRINTIESQMSGLESRIDAIGSRLSVVEFCVGIGPDMRSLDTEIAQTRRAKEHAAAE